MKSSILSIFFMGIYIIRKENAEAQSYREKNFVILRLCALYIEIYNPNLIFAPIRHQRPGWGMVA